MKDIVKSINNVLKKLKFNEQKIIANNISERTITHKMAEYLQLEFTDYDVDCEYNRNYEVGKDEPKFVYTLKNEVRDKYRKAGITEENMQSFAEEVTTYPDIIVHQRLTNKKNLLVIEVKKNNNNSNWEMDDFKLKWFTTQRENDGYGYKLGLHITLYVQEKWKNPTLNWYRNGKLDEELNMSYNNS